MDSTRLLDSEIESLELYFDRFQVFLGVEELLNVRDVVEVLFELLLCITYGFLDISIHGFPVLEAESLRFSILERASLDDVVDDAARRFARIRRIHLHERSVCCLYDTFSRVVKISWYSRRDFMVLGSVLGMFTNKHTHRKF